MLRFEFSMAPAAAPSLVFAVGVLLSGCSADVLRFDSPAFSLSADPPVTATRQARAPAGNSLYDHRETAGSSQRYGGDAGRQMPHVSRGMSEPDGYQPKRTAVVAPLLQADRDRSTDDGSLTTGALRTPHNTVSVQRGDSLYAISRRHGVTVDALRRANNLSGSIIRPGQTLVVPSTDNAWQRNAPMARAPERSTGGRRMPAQEAVSVDQRRVERAPNDRADANPSLASYVVQPGDSLYRISRETGVSVASLKRINGITNVRAIRAGTRLSLGTGTAPANETATSPDYAAGRNYAAPSREYETARSDANAPRRGYAAASRIKPKSIKTMPIVREPIVRTPTVQAPIVQAKADLSVPDGSADRPRILNKRRDTPIATKPRETAARATAPAQPARFLWPARGRVIASFNHSGQGVKNDGINIALKPGTDIAAAASGVVAYAGSELKGYGNLVLLRHDNGWVSAYAHARRLLVKRGDRVARGQVIAKAGRSGDVAKSQLHFELRKGAKPVDPLPHLEQL